MRSAELRPELPACSSDPLSFQQQTQRTAKKEIDARPPGHILKNTVTTNPETLEDDEFGDDDFKDQEVINAGTTTFLYLRCPEH